MAKDTNIAICPFPLVFTDNRQRARMFQGLCFLPLPLYSLLIFSILSSVRLSNVPGVEYDWGAHPKLVCMPLPADTDPSCFPPDRVTHDPSINAQNNGHVNSHTNGHGRDLFTGGLPNSAITSSSKRSMSDEAKATILHLRESLVRQKETILDQRETIRELTAKLTLCEGFGRGADGHHNEDYHGHHGSYQTSHYDSDHHSDLHYPLNGYHNDHQRGKPPFLGKHGFSPEQAGKTLQALKERLENLQARNSSSTYSSSLKDLLQRKINALEEQLHRYYAGHNDYVTHASHSGHSGHDDHQREHHDNHDNNHRYGPHYSRYRHHYDQLGTHHNNNDNHHDDHRSDHKDDHQDSQQNEHHDDHQLNPHDSGHHGNADHGHQSRSSHKPSSSRSRGSYNKLDSVLSHLYHRSPETGNHKRPKNPDGFQIGFPMHTNYMYGRIKRTLLNEIFALTVCLWLKGGSGPGIGTPFSYSVPGQANELVIIEWANSPIELLVNDKIYLSSKKSISEEYQLKPAFQFIPKAFRKAVTLPLSLHDSKWHHLCVTWSTRDGVWEAYQNGVKRGSGENLSPWHPIKPGGVFILGQEQDTLGGRFDATQSFVGEMSDLQVWSRVLNSQEIDNQATCSNHLTGDVIAWNESIVELHGGVTKYPFDPCH